MPLPTSEDEQRAKWDLLLLDVELRHQQNRWETWRFVLQAMTAGAALFGAGAASATLFIHFIR